MEREPHLLDLARANLPSLPVDELDVLIVDRLGKNISGSGMDTNIIGRIMIAGQPEPERPRIGAIMACGITPESHGNATGMGLADVVTQRFRDQIDFDVTNRNIVTSGFLERGKMPVVAADDREAFDWALRAAGCWESKDARVVRIKDTLHLGEMLVSESVARELRSDSTIEIQPSPTELFDLEDRLTPW
jgi:hypothetical protein